MEIIDIIDTYGIEADITDPYMYLADQHILRSDYTLRSTVTGESIDSYLISSTFEPEVTDVEDLLATIFLDAYAYENELFYSTYPRKGDTLVEVLKREDFLTRLIGETTFWSIAGATGRDTQEFIDGIDEKGAPARYRGGEGEDFD